MTEDVNAKYKEWSERGVRFTTAPETPGWGGTYARFEDPDGNAFGLEGFDEARQSRVRHFSRLLRSGHHDNQHSVILPRFDFDANVAHAHNST
jgi:hypothetical protein